MNITIKNNFYKAEISTHGAEVQSFTRLCDGKNIIWNGDESVWKNHAPILFPFVARCLGGYFMIEGKKCEYEKNHGFARDLEHKIIEQSDSKAVFELLESSETLNRFPYSFSLRTSYELTDTGLLWKITVRNTDKKTFRFGLGTHAAFSMEGEAAENFVVEFEKKENLTSVLCTPEGYIAADKNGNAPLTKPYGEKEAGTIPVTEKGFGNGHLFTNFKSEWVGLKNLKTGDITKISTKGFPYCMIWQNTAGSPQFVCIEPWHGIPDAENTDHDWAHKIGMNELSPGEEFTCEQDISA